MDQNTQNSAQNKITPTRCAFYMPAEGKLEDAYGVAEGFCKSVKVREVTGKDGARKKVADVEISAIMRSSRIAALFGEDYLYDKSADYNSVRFRVTYWGYAAENLEKYPPQENQRVFALVNRVKLNSFPTSKGGIYRSVEGTGIEYLQTTSARKPDGKSALADAQTQQAAPAPAPQGYQQPVYQQTAPAAAPQGYQQPAYQQTVPAAVPQGYPQITYQQPAAVPQGYQQPVYQQTVPTPAPQGYQQPAPVYQQPLQPQAGIGMSSIDFDDDDDAIPF